MRGNIVNVVVFQTQAEGRIRYLYLMDCILKTVDGIYIKLFQKHAVGVICSTFQYGNRDTR